MATRMMVESEWEKNSRNIACIFLLMIASLIAFVIWDNYQGDQDYRNRPEHLQHLNREEFDLYQTSIWYYALKDSLAKNRKRDREIMDLARADYMSEKENREPMAAPNYWSK